MIEIIKCSDCGQKLDKAFAVVQTDPDNPDEITYTHKGCTYANTEQVTCMICEKKFKMITPGHLAKHDSTVREYKLRYGPVISWSQAERLRAQSRSTRGSDDELFVELRSVRDERAELMVERDTLRQELTGALQTVENHSNTIETQQDRITQLEEYLEASEPQLDNIASERLGIEEVHTGPRTIGVVFTMEEIETIGAVALREMVKCKFGRWESKKSQNIEKLRGLVE